MTLQVAAPELLSTGRESQSAIVAPPSANATVPPSGAGVTVAVYVTVSPVVEGFGDEDSVVVVAAACVMTTRDVPAVVLAH